MYVITPNNYKQPVYIYDPKGNMVGTVCMVKTKNNYTSFGFDFPREYRIALKPRVVTPQLFGDCDQDDYAVPDDACNEY